MATSTNENKTDNSSNIPTWINANNFQSVLEENVEGFKKILNFEVKETGGGGENYASMMMRVKVKAELIDKSTKDIAFMIKTIPQGEHGAGLVAMMGLFPKETTMYGKYLQEFEKLYQAAGKKVTFGPKFYKFKNLPDVEYVLLEDLSPRGFKNLNRRVGLDKEHTQSVLKLIAKLHAVSAVYYELNGPFEPSFMNNPFKEDQLDAMMKPLVAILKASFEKHETGRKYLPKLEPTFENWTQRYIEDNTVNFDDFNVMIHGDLWANNIMFRHNDEGKLQETILVDFQMSRYGSPVVDLFYFLLSSPSLELKVNCFDEFIQFYHEHLQESLKLLNYPKKLPTLKHLRMSLLKYSAWSISTATGIMAAVLLDPTENANIDNFFDESETANDFRLKLYDNPRFIKHLNEILPWMDRMGYLDDL